MKMSPFKRIVALALLICTSWGFSLALPSTAHAEWITLVADEWCPYNCEPGSEKPGFMVEIARTILGEEGIKVRYKLFPWSRAMDEVRQDRAQGAIATLEEEVPDFIFPGQEQGMSTMILVAKKDSTWRYDGVESLSQIRIAAAQDYYYGEDVDRYIKENENNPLKVHITAGDTPFINNLKMLRHDRVDAILVDRDVFCHYGYLNDLKDEFIEVGEVDAAPLYIAFGPGNPQSPRYAKLLAEGMVKLRASGKLEEILSRYGLVDWNDPITMSALVCPTLQPSK